MEEVKTMEDILRRAAAMTDEEITQIALMLCRRFDELHPESELIFISLPRNDRVERASILNAIANS